MRITTMKNLLTLLLGAFLIIGLVVCDDSSTGNDDDDDYGDIPANPVPADFAAGEPLNAILHWSPVDPEYLSHYTVYLGADSIPPLLADVVLDTFIDPGILSPNTQYYWRVISEENPPNTAANPLWRFGTMDEVTYPLTSGARWDYNVRIFHSNVRPESIASQFADTIDGSSTVRVTGLETLFDDVEVYVFHEEYADGDMNSVTSDAYFNATEDGFMYYGATGGNYVAPLKPASGMTYTFGGQSYSSPVEIFRALQAKIPSPLVAGTTDLHDPPLVSLAYPLEYGAEWNFRPDDDPWRIDKEVTGFEQVNVPAGNFDCFEVRWIYSGFSEADSVDYYDYIAEEGLVMRTITIYDVRLTDYASPDSIGVADFTSDYLLNDYNINPAAD